MPQHTSTRSSRLTKVSRLLWPNKIIYNNNEDNNDSISLSDLSSEMPNRTSEFRKNMLNQHALEFRLVGFCLFQFVTECSNSKKSPIFLSIGLKFNCCFVIPAQYIIHCIIFHGNDINLWHQIYKLTYWKFQQWIE